MEEARRGRRGIYLTCTEKVSETRSLWLSCVEPLPPIICDIRSGISGSSC
jgi:hypothetical protein